MSGFLKTFVPTALLLLAGLVGFQPACAVATELLDIYVSPKGSGVGDGHSTLHAATLEQALLTAKSYPSRLILAEGNYDVSRLYQSELQGQPAQPLVIEGSGPKTVLIGKYRPGGAWQPTLFVLRGGDVTLRNFTVRNVPRFIAVRAGATAERVLIQKIVVVNVFDGIVIDRNKVFIARDWVIEDVKISRYVRVGIRLAGAQTENIVVRRSVIDGGATQLVNDCFKGGIQLYQSVHDVTIEDVRVLNNVGCVGAAYQQGDGIEADDTGGAPERITLRRVLATGNRDGNFDLKAKNMRLENVVSVGSDISRHGLRFWNYAYLCVPCRLYGPNSDFHLTNTALVLRNPAPTDAASYVRCNDRPGAPSSTYRIELKGVAAAPASCPPPL